MRLNTTAALFLVFVVSLSFAGLILKQRNIGLVGGGSQSALELAGAFRSSYILLTSSTFTNNLLLFLTHSTYVNVAETSRLLLNKTREPRFTTSSKPILAFSSGESATSSVYP